MPYEWNIATGPPVVSKLELWPHRSLPRRGFAGFILATAVMISMPLFMLLGTALLWGLLPFLLLTVAGLWWGLERSYRDAEIREVLRIDDKDVRLVRINPDGHRQDWECNRYWVRVELYATGGPVSNYVTLRGSDRQVEIGAFLSEDERVALFAELKAYLR